MQSGNITNDDRQAFQAWLEADPDHARQYRDMQFLWGATLKLPEDRLRGMLAPAAGPALRRPRADRRRFGLGLAGALALAVVAAMTTTADVFHTPQDTMTLATQKGERREVRLPDGSSVRLNTDTLAIMRFYDDQRHIELRHGEAFFEVSTDAARPFVVEAGLGQITVTGTRFNVRRDPQALQVSVASGSVLVQSSYEQGHGSHWLMAGEQTTVVTGLGMRGVQQADVDDVVAWMRGKVIFNNAPLAYVIDEMNRYLDQPARLEAAHVGRHRVSGVFSVDDPDAMINALPAIAPVRLVRKPDGRVSVVPR